MIIKFDTPRAAVRVKKTYGRKLYHLDFQENGMAICVIKAGTPFIPLPDGSRVLGPDDQVIQPSGRFYISAETIDPYHVIIDA